MKKTASSTLWMHRSQQQRWPGIIDWERRYDHMQQHTGQHLLSAVLEELFKIRTVSFHLGS